MSGFVQSPNLPRRCCAVIYGERYAPSLRPALEKRGIESILLPDNPAVDTRLAGHADLSVLHAGGECLFLAPYLRGSAFALQMQDLGAALHFPEMEHGKTYPRDAQLNLCLLGETVIGNRKTACPDAVNYLTIEKGKPFLPVRQGYSRCAVCIVDSSSLITADRGIADAAEGCGLDVLRIEPGFVALAGFAYGFLGGASFKLSSSQMAFTGTLDRHPDRDRILDFLAVHTIEAIYLTQDPIFDIGSFIPITEQ